ncbi:GNAT family N-acetyltransferase [Pseudonocardia zijingensis]|uniref:GNAT family N-acetyltransferase n=1 Tax=Pseudonocardia zijingensis TaxID=153376 RepID=A0ABN1PQI0_9PSEU
MIDAAAAAPYGVRVCSASDCEIAIQVLTAAFADDPVFRWLLFGDVPGVDVARLVLPVVEQSAGQGELVVGPDGAGTAVWLRRGAEPPAGDEAPLPDELARPATFTALVDQRYPVGRPHLYLAFLGVVPGVRGRGTGGALLRERLARADADRVPAYLEASSARSRSLYERHGFRTTGAPIVLPDGPRLWPMWREPRP